MKNINIKHSGAISAICLVAVVFVLLKSSIAYPFPYKGWDIKINGSVAEKYDDNITFTNENKKEDFITRLSLGLALKHEVKTRTMDFTGRINRRIFAGYRNFSNTSEDITLSFRNEFSRYERIKLNNVFTHTYVPVDFEEAFGRTEGIYSSYTNRFNLAYTRDLTKQFSFIARYANELKMVSREDLNDSYLNRLGVAAEYIPGVTTTLFFSYHFAERVLFRNAEDVYTHTIVTGIRKRLTRQAYFDATAGIDYISNDNAYIKPVVQVSLTDEIDRKSVARLSFKQKYQTYSDMESHFSYWQTSGFFRRQLFKKLSCALSGFYGQGKYVPLNITDRLVGARIAFNYDLRKNLKGNSIYTYSDKDSTKDGRRYSKNTMFLGLTAEF